MRFNPVLISCFLFASAVLANARRPQQLNLPERSSDSPVVDSSYRSGAVWTLEPGTFNYVHAIFAVPNVASVNGLDSFADVLVTIDGYADCPNDVMIGLGLNFHASPSGSTYIEAVIFNSTDSFSPETLDIPISVGDFVQLEIITFNATTGRVFIDNLTNHRSVDRDVQLSVPLCGQTAGWIVRGGSYTLANFGTVIFTGASAGTRGGASYQPYGATLLRNRGQNAEGNDATMSSTIAFNESPLWVTYLNYE